MRTLGALGWGLLLLTGPGAARADDNMPGPIDSLDEAQEAGRMAFKMADTNNDGQISQREAVDLGNLLVGGFFFRADADGNGTVSPEEARQAREALFAQQPMLRFILERAKGANAQPGQPNAANTANQDPIRGIGNLLDTNNDRQLQAAEVRQAVQSAVQGLYATADTNRDGQMSPTEINAAIAGLARSIAQTAFQQADTDHNGQISQAEFEKAIVEPSRVAFRVLDTNNDGEISPQEAQSAQRFVAYQLRALRVPEPANSARHLIQTGRTPAQAAPVPNFGTPNRPAAPSQP
jgi:Ca2+-binding EF-hand superfamily protein